MRKTNARSVLRSALRLVFIGVFALPAIFVCGAVIMLGYSQMQFPYPFPYANAVAQKAQMLWVRDNMRKLLSTRLMLLLVKSDAITKNR